LHSSIGGRLAAFPWRERNLLAPSVICLSRRQLGIKWNQSINGGTVAMDGPYLHLISLFVLPLCLLGRCAPPPNWIANFEFP